MPQDLQQPEPGTPLDEGPLWTPKVHRRFLLGLIALLCLVLVVVLPPYIGISRYQRRVAAAISSALGRPVHFDRIALHLLPLPGLTIENFVVEESPEFGSEPVLRASTVEARLRVASLWRRRIEVSRISLDTPSINLVRRREDGRWNLQGIVTRASQLDSAPTAQRRAGETPRFPYIEATDARINIKNGNDKLPFSIKGAEFALWLPEPDQWRLRLSGQPVRTDTDVSDVGLLRVEATLGRAADLSNTAIQLSANWKPTPLGEASKLTVGYDAGWRGEVSADATLRGTLGQAKVVTDVHLLALRRADYMPEHTAEVNAHCEAITAGLLRGLHDLRCGIPTNNDTSFLGAIEALRRLPAPDTDQPEATTGPGILLVRGEVPNVLDWRSASGTASLSGASAGYAMAWARLFSRRISPGVQLGGTLDLNASTAAPGTAASQWTGLLMCECILPPVSPPSQGSRLRPFPAKAALPNRWKITVHHDLTQGDALAVLAYPNVASASEGAETLVPMVPAGLVVSGQVRRTGYTIMYGSAEAARRVATILPSLADGMPADATGGLAAERAWTGAQTWTETKPGPRKPEIRHRRRR